MSDKTHLGHALHWSTDTGVQRVEMLTAGLGMAAPLALAAALGHVGLGMAAAMGSMALSGAPTRGDTAGGATVTGHARALLDVIAPAALAALAMAGAAGHGWLTDAIILLLASIAATVGGYSRPMVVASIRFVLFLAITANAFATAVPVATHQVALLLLFLAGALWTMALALLLDAVAGSGTGADVATPAPSGATHAQKRARWKRTLKEWSGWQYTARLTVCLGIASVLRGVWPTHHLYWIMLTVALLTQRQIEVLSVKTTQRMLGTVLGIVVASVFVAVQPPLWAMIACIGLIAAARPWLRARNGLAYAALMTPLVILIMDIDRPAGIDVLLDRLLATLIGVVLVIAANALAARRPA